MGPEPEGSGDRPEGGFRTVIERARSGDRKAFEQLMATHQWRVIRTTRALLGNREDAQDAAQEVFLRVFRYLHRFDPQREFAPWLYRVAVNVCRDIHRRRAQTHATPLEDLKPEVLATPADQETKADAVGRLQAIREALRELSVREREVVVLRDVEGLSTPEVAGALGCMEVTVRTHLSRGRLKLRTALSRMRGWVP